MKSARVHCFAFTSCVVILMKCINWNVEWAPPGRERGARIREKITSLSADVLCLTECRQGLVAMEHIIEPGADYGYGETDRRKVSLFSQTAWSQVDTFGSEALPGGRFVSGVTRGVRFVGICIPWSGAHVSSGLRNRRRWQDHLAYIEGLQKILSGYAVNKEPICILGDFNQRVPGKRQPKVVYEALKKSFSRYSIATAGLLDEDEKLLIDHVAVSSGLTVSAIEIIPKSDRQNVRLTDHSGICFTLN